MNGAGLIASSILKNFRPIKVFLLATIEANIKTTGVEERYGTGT
jgi:hypothetical protein